MGNFTPVVKESLDFDGDSIEVVFKRLKNKQQLLLIPHINEKEEQDIKLRFKGFSDLAIVASQILPENIVSMRGLKSADGNELSISDIIEEAYFSPLIVRIIGLMMASSSVRTYEKNSDAPLTQSSAA